MKYGYCRISKPKQVIERQIRNIKAEYPDAAIIQEIFTRTRMDRKEWLRLIQLAGDLLGVIELGFGVCAGLKANEDEPVIDTGDNAKVIGARYQLTKSWEVRVLGGSFDRESDTELAGCFILYNSHHACNNKISGGIEVSHIRGPLPRERGCGDDGINPYCLNCNSIIADTNDSAGNADADFDTTGCIEFSLPLQHRSLSACDCGVVLEIYADEDKVNGCSEHPAKSHTMLQRDVLILGPHPKTFAGRESERGCLRSQQRRQENCHPWTQGH